MMNSSILDSIGLSNIDPAYFIIGLMVAVLTLLILVAILFSKYVRLDRKYKNFFQDKNGKSLEKELVAIFEDNRFLKTSVEQNKKDIKTINKNLQLTFQKAGLNKYDAFKEMGGKLSYSLALLNDYNDGFILNSVSSSDGCYSYAKVIKGGVCSIELGEEEQKALNMAIGINN